MAFDPAFLHGVLTPRLKISVAREKGASLLLVLGFYAALIGVWQLVYELEVWSPYLLPEPNQVFQSVRRYIDNGVLLESIETTMQRMLVGFAIAFVLGMTMGIATGTVKWVDQTLGSLVLGMQSLPSI